jgi:glycosyltransferase involved in cell wall biosynthesis
MSEPGLVSVVMIFFNAEAFIAEAIESVLAQTYPHWELLLVDDGSTDGSTAIAQKIERQHPRQARYLRPAGHTNGGMSAARNLGLRASRGEFIAFLDADDVFLPEKLEQQVSCLAAWPQAGMVYGTTLYWHSWTGQPADAARDRPRTLGVPVDRLYAPPELVRRFAQTTARTPATCAALIRRTAIQRAGGFDENFRGMYEDQVFFHKLCQHVPVFVESGCWSRYRQHPASHVAARLQSGAWQRDERPAPDELKFLEWLEAYLAEQPVKDPATRRAVAERLFPYRHPRLYPFYAAVQRAPRLPLAAWRRAAEWRRARRA